MPAPGHYSADGIRGLAGAKCFGQARVIDGRRFYETGTGAVIAGVRQCLATWTTSLNS
jgi:hypothetical protein